MQPNPCTVNLLTKMYYVLNKIILNGVVGIELICDVDGLVN